MGQGALAYPKYSRRFLAQNINGCFSFVESWKSINVNVYVEQVYFRGQFIGGKKEITAKKNLKSLRLIFPLGLSAIRPTQ